MPRSIVVPERQYDQGQQYQVDINGIPSFKDGFKVTFTRVAWPLGAVANIQIDFATDGVNFQHWIGATLAGVAAIDEQPVSGIQATWPGENDGSGGRRALAKSEVRATMSVVQTFRTAIAMTDI